MYEEGKICPAAGACPAQEALGGDRSAQPLPHLPESRCFRLAGSAALEEVALARHPLRGEQATLLDGHGGFHSL